MMMGSKEEKEHKQKQRGHCASSSRVGLLVFFSVDLSPPREFWPLDPLPPVQTIPQDHARDDCVFTPMNGISIRERANKRSLGEQPPSSTRRLANLIG